MGPVFALVLWLTTAASASAQAPAVAVTGVVQDQTGAVLSGATVSWSTARAQSVQTTTADAAGAFRFDGVAPGQYELRAASKDSSRRPRSCASAAGRPHRRSSCSISPRLRRTSPSARRRRGRRRGGQQRRRDHDRPGHAREPAGLRQRLRRDDVAVSRRRLDRQRRRDHRRQRHGGERAQRQRLGDGADPDQSGSVFGGVLAAGPRPHRDPDQARVAAVSRRGHADFPQRATSTRAIAFASTKPPEQRRIVEGFLGGPIGRSGKTTFMLSANDESLDQQAYIYAIGPDGTIHDKLPHTSGEARLTGSITRQVSDKNTLSIRPNYQYESDENRGVGGTTLASAATTFTHHEQQVTYTQQTMLRPTLVNQFQMLFGHEREPTASASPARAIIVAGAFTGGGAQVDLVRTETHINLNESLAGRTASISCRPDFSCPTGAGAASTTGPTSAARSISPTSSPTPPAAVRVHPAAGQRRPGLARETGRRLRQGRLAGPRRALAVVRPALRLAELFPRHQQCRAALVAGVCAGQRQGQRAPRRRRRLQRSQRARGDCRRAAFAAGRAGEDRDHRSRLSRSVRVRRPPRRRRPSIVQLAPDVQIPQTLQYSVSLDHQVRRGRRCRWATPARAATACFARATSTRRCRRCIWRGRIPRTASIRQVESNGRQQADSLRRDPARPHDAWFNGQMQYTLSRAYNDTAASMRFRRTTTTSRVSGRARMSIAGIAS